MNRPISQHATNQFIKPLSVLMLTAVLLTLPSSLEAAAIEASDLLSLAGTPGGLIVHAGCGDGKLTAQLRKGDQYFVHGLDKSATNVAAARTNIIEQGIYGPVSIDQWDGAHLPYADNLVNLIIVEDAPGLSQQELMRALAPNGVALVRTGGQLTKLVKPWPKEMDQWTHYLHGPDGNPVANDTLIGPPTQLQWVGGPAWARHHDHMASMTSLVSSNGKLFYIFDEGPTASIQLPSQWRLVARDAFNGIILWKRNIDQWNTAQYPLKSGPAHLLRRLVAVGDRVYVTLSIDAPVTVLDGADGRTLWTYADSEHTREIVVSDDIALFVADTSRSRLPDWRRKHTYVWANSSEANPGWGWNGTKRKILAYKADSPSPIWQAETPVAPCSLAADSEKVVFHDGEKLICLNRRNGDTLWEGDPCPTKLPVPTSTGPRVLIYKDVVLLAPNTSRMSGWSLKDGKKLWEQPHRPSGHQSLKDLFVVQGLAWTGSIAGSSNDGTFTGYDPATGKVVKEFPADVKVHWFHHRCYPSKAADKYLLTARNGTEYIDLTTEHWKPHHWVRGGCIYGVMPCNGLTYAPMNSCGCQLEAKLTGFNALSAAPVPQITKADLSNESRLETGPAYRKARGPAAGSADWPTYRHDAGRSGAGSATVSANLKNAWQTELGGRLTAPTIAAGMLYVASIDTHTLHALNARTGKKLWSYTTGAPIDSPPTYHKGLVLFGSADGYVYALRATDGVLAWRFRGAPIDRRIMAWEKLESAWPVHGSVLVYDDVLYCTAGRNMYVNGGLRLIRLDPQTGKLIGETVMDDKDPVTGQDMHLAYLKQTQGNNMPVAHSDILSCDGKHIWLRSQKITLDGKRIEIALQNVKEQEPEDFHLFCQNGFLDDSYFFRSYWTYGRRMTGGYGGWYQAGRLVPSGRILCFDDKHVYGYGRKPEFMVNSSVLEYQLFATDKLVTQQAIERIGKAERNINARSTRRNANSSDWLLRHFFPPEVLSAATIQWTLDQPAIIARAMAVAADTLFVAGPPDVIDERLAYHHPDDPEVKKALQQQADALKSRSAGQLWAFDKTSGKLLSRYALDAAPLFDAPVFDGMAAAGNSLYMTTKDGRVLCLSSTGRFPLKAITGKPTQVKWDQPEDPNYLLPPEEPKDDDFTKVSGCRVVASKLGYRLRSDQRRQVGMAIKKLDQPITTAATFKTRAKAVPNAGSLLRNGYLAFGDGVTDGKLIKCGAKLKTQQASIIQGPLPDAKPRFAAIKAPDNKGAEITVHVDLKTQTVTLTVNGVTIESKIQRPLKRITHVGYVMDRALIDFTPIEIQRR